MRDFAFTVRTGAGVSVHDVTGEVRRRLGEAGKADGVLYVFTAHTTCALVVNEAEEGLMDDLGRLIRLLEPLAPFRHDRVDDNARSHLCAALLGGHVALPVTGGRIEAGTWQSILLVELDGPRTRQVRARLLA